VSYYAVGAAIAAGKGLAGAIIALITRIFPHFPIAEQITVELLLWSVPVTLLVLALGFAWVKLFGWRVKRLARSLGSPSSPNYFERVRLWDYARVPDDIGLMLVSFGAVAVLLTVAFWAFLSPITPHPHPD